MTDLYQDIGSDVVERETDSTAFAARHLTRWAPGDVIASVAMMRGVGEADAVEIGRASIEAFRRSGMTILTAETRHRRW
jgi:hypothetical protein